jgi:hypothetical protein
VTTAALDVRTVTRVATVPASSITRQAIRTPRAAAVAGIAFAALLTIAVVLIRLAVSGGSDKPSKWLTDGSRRDAIVLALNLLPFSGIAFLWFIGVVRDRIGQGEDRFFATVFLGSGLLFIAMLFATGAMASALLAPDALPTEEVWSFGRRASYTLLTVYAMRMAAVFTISTTTIAARLGLAPRWLTGFGLATGVVLLLSVGVVPWIELIFPAWVFTLSVYILVASFRTSPSSVGG